MSKEDQDFFRDDLDELRGREIEYDDYNHVENKVDNRPLLGYFTHLWDEYRKTKG